MSFLEKKERKKRPIAYTVSGKDDTRDNELAVNSSDDIRIEL
jgi:hypothetical protein